MRREMQSDRGKGREGSSGFRAVLARVVEGMLGRGAVYRAGESPGAAWAKLREHGVMRDEVRDLAARGLGEQAGGRVVLTRAGLAEAVELLEGGARGRWRGAAGGRGRVRRGATGSCGSAACW